MALVLRLLLDRRVTIASGSKAAGILKNTGTACTRLDEHQPRAQKKQRERDPPRKS